MILQADRAPGVTATIATLSALAYIFFGLRVYTRTKHVKWGIDDSIMAAAMLPFTGLSISCLGGSLQGIGTHENRLSSEQHRDGLAWFFFFEEFYCVSVIPIKLSISFALIRVAGRRMGYIKALWVISVGFTVMNLIAFFYIMFHCTPPKYSWDMSIPGGKCKPLHVLADIYYATTAVNILTDWIVAILPIPLLWNVQLNRNVKISIGFLLSLGILASLSGCIRLSYTYNLLRSDDWLYGMGDLVIWGHAENALGVIASCAATLRPILRGLLGLGPSLSSGSFRRKSSSILREHFPLRNWSLAKNDSEHRQEGNSESKRFDSIAADNMKMATAATDKRQSA